jgi:hypothetical protein
VSILDKLFGRDEAPQPRPSQWPGAGAPQSADEQAIARYRYMLKTPEQRSMLLQHLSADMPDAERRAAGVSVKDDPQSLARLATRAEVRQPGTMERTFAGMGGRGMGVGSMMAGSFLASMAGVVIGSAIAQSFLGDSGHGDTAGGESSSGDMSADTSADAGSDVGDFEGGDFGEV